MAITNYAQIVPFIEAVKVTRENAADVLKMYERVSPIEIVFDDSDSTYTIKTEDDPEYIIGKIGEIIHITNDGFKDYNDIFHCSEEQFRLNHIPLDENHSINFTRVWAEELNEKIAEFIERTTV